MTAWRPGFVLFVATLLLMAVPRSAAKAQVSAEAVLAATVGIAVTVSSDARTAATLGTERSGNGIVIDAQGLVLTIGYLIIEADEIFVTTDGGKTLPAASIAYSAETGFGLLRIQGESGTKPLAFGDSDTLDRGKPVLVAGFGGVRAVRPALVVERREFAGPWEYLLDGAIFTAPPHPSFGGAGLVGEDGRLLGIGYLLVANAAGGETVVPGNMFVPINLLKPALADLLAGQPAATPRPWLGLYSSETRDRLFVERVAADGPADRAGIKAGDIVLGVAGEPVTSMADFYKKVWARGPAGTPVPLDILQGVRTRQVEIPSIDRTKWFREPRTF